MAMPALRALRSAAVAPALSPPAMTREQLGPAGGGSQRIVTGEHRRLAGRLRVAPLRQQRLGERHPRTAGMRLAR